MAMTTAAQTINGVAPADRDFDKDLGGCLHLRPGATVVSNAPRGALDDFTLSFG